MANEDRTGRNRRQSVRVSDRVLFLCKPLSEERCREIEADFRRGIPLYNQQELADIQMYIGAQSALSKIRERDGNLADFLQHLDNKLNLVLQAVQGEHSPFETFVPQEVDLSGTGIAFHADTKLKPGETVELHLVLLPEYTYIYAIARIVKCGKPDSDSPDKARSHCMAAQFLLIMEEDREKLIQHNFKLQSLALRNRRVRR